MNETSTKDIQESQKVVTCAFLSRVVIILASIWFHEMISDYDTSQQVMIDQSEPSWLERRIKHLSNWDGVHFLAIARNGYLFEQQHAFFPFFPFLIWIFARPLSFLFNEPTSLLLSGLFISNMSFILSAIEFFRLSRTILKHPSLAFSSSILYCLTPASIFMSAIYTESPFALFSFMGMRFFFQQEKWKATFCFMLAGWTRANGILFCGFFGFEAISLLYSFSFSSGLTKQRLIQSLVHLAFLSLLVLSPYILFQIYGYNIYCNSLHPQPWCFNKIPNLYGYVQANYWNQGFLRYFQFKQIPNFLLASPMIFISLCGIFSYWHFLLVKGWNHLENTGYLNKSCLVYIFYWTFLLLFAVTSTHVQTITRFFASCPPLYWFLGSFFQDVKSPNRVTRMILVYFFMYMIIGTLLFSNFYPWT